MTDNEKAVVTALANAWNAFCLLPQEHDDDCHEFRSAIHSAQQIVLARTGRREYNSAFMHLGD